MATSANQTSPFNLFSAPAKDETDPYLGSIEFKTHTIVFAYGTITILRQNITRVERYGVKQVFRIPDPLYYLSIILAIISLLIGFGFSPAFLFTLIFGIVFIAGLAERNRPKLSGLTIELNSGYTYSFLHQSKEAITQLYKDISEALETGFTFSAKFEQNNIVIDRSVHSTIGDNVTGVNVAGADSTINSTLNKI